jgi:RNA polymerase sigma-70 factor, ECF subfamily
LVGRVLDGDAKAFTVLVDRHAGSCLRFATRMLGNREDAEDATQEALLRAYRSLGDFNRERSFRTWLFTILVNRCRTLALHRSRRERRVGADESAVARAESIPAPALVTIDQELDEDLRHALERLEPAQREAFLLKHVEELSYEEMAESTGVGVSALKMRVKRACDRLQVLLQEVRMTEPTLGSGDSGPDPEGEDVLSPIVARAASSMRADVQIRDEWRAGLMNALREEESRNTERPVRLVVGEIPPAPRRWSVRPYAAVAAGLALFTLGAATAAILTRGNDRQGVAAPNVAARTPSSATGGSVTAVAMPASANTFAGSGSTMRFMIVAPAASRGDSTD